jgi:hypothetical protein
MGQLEEKWQGLNGLPARQVRRPSVAEFRANGYKKADVGAGAASTAGGCD